MWMRATVIYIFKFSYYTIFTSVFVAIQFGTLLCSHRIANNGPLHLITPNGSENSIQRQENETEIKNDFSFFYHFWHRFSVSIRSCLRNAFQSHSMEIVFLTAQSIPHYFLAFEFLWWNFHIVICFALHKTHFRKSLKNKKSIDVITTKRVFDFRYKNLFVSVFSMSFMLIVKQFHSFLSSIISIRFEWWKLLLVTDRKQEKWTIQGVMVNPLDTFIPIHK